jgi:serine/threonine protein kinase
MLTGEQFGRYEIRSKIGEGGMGEVYTAHDSELGRSVAIKLLPGEFTDDPERRSRFKQEARVVSALNHPNIITIYEVGENEHGSFLATEYVEGRTLREVINHESLTLPRILHIIEQAANALVAAHAAEIIHRDIKPENIMVRLDSIVKVLDFGLAKPNGSAIAASNGNIADNKTIPGTVMGSARYMSPEQARGHVVDQRTDIWSLGVVLYEMLTGTVPFKGDTTADTLAAVIYREPAPIANVLPNAPVELQRIVRKALQKDREERYQSVKDLALDIKDLIFDLEHSNSGDRIAHSASSPEFSENPTILHTTKSGNHLTDRSHTMTALSGFVRATPAKLSVWILPVAVAALLLVLASGFGVYRWFGDGVQPQAASAFEKTQVSRLNSDGKVMQPAMSPDGRYIAYISGEVGNLSLVVRQVATDSSVTVVQPTNLNLQNITFSHDGDHIYYTLTRSDFSVSTLYQVPTLGGTPKKLIEDIDSGITFSPDGKRFAFMRHATTNNTDNMFIVDAATLEMQPLISTPGTGYDFIATRFAWSPDGKSILVGAGKKQNGFVVSTDLAEVSIENKSIRPLHADHEFFSANNFVWFSDGSGFLFTGRESQNSPSQIWRALYPSGEIQKVTNDFNDYYDCSISADGRSIVTVKGDTSSAIWNFSPAAKKLEQVTAETRNAEGANGLGQMPDGRLIYTRLDGKESDIWTSDPDGKNPRALLTDPGFSFAPATVPGGKYIVYTLQKDKTSRLWRIDADGKNAVRLTDDDPKYADYQGQVTPDGKYVIFQRMIADQERSVLMKVSIDGGTAEPLFESEKWSVFQPRLSPDGKRLAFVSYDVKTFEKHVEIATLQGSSFGKIERELDFNLLNQIQWSPDGQSLTAISNRGGVLNLWRIPIDGSPAVPVTDFKSGRILNFGWAADGKNILLTRGNTNNDLILIRDSARFPSADSVERRKTRPLA